MDRLVSLKGFVDSSPEREVLLAFVIVCLLIVVFVAVSFCGCSPYLGVHVFFIFSLACGILPNDQPPTKGNEKHHFVYQLLSYLLYR